MVPLCHYLPTSPLFRGATIATFGGSMPCPSCDPLSRLCSRLSGRFWARFATIRTTSLRVSAHGEVHQDILAHRSRFVGVGFHRCLVLQVTATLQGRAGREFVSPSCDDSHHDGRGCCSRWCGVGYRLPVAPCDDCQGNARGFTASCVQLVLAPPKGLCVKASVRFHGIRSRFAVQPFQLGSHCRVVIRPVREAEY